MASSGKQWYVGEDGCILIGELANSVTYHSALNSIIVTTNEPAVKVYDVTSGSVLQKSDLSACKGDKVKCLYLQEKNKMVFCNSQAIGVRSDLQGVLLLDTALQTPVAKSDELVRIELPLAEAVQFLKSLTSTELSCLEYSEVVIKELEKQIDIAQEATKGNHKTTKWATVCVEVPHVALKTVSSSLEAEMRRVNVHSPGLSIASSVSDRLCYLLPSNNTEQTGTTVDRTLMYSEAARRETFTKWPHMNYKWALPDPMAQAGFYHQPNVSGDDRAMCFTCNVCLVCWEPTDEPWSEHERHSPSCPFVKGEHTQNVPLSVTYATQPALTQSDSGQIINCVSMTANEDFIATSTKNGSVILWSLKRIMKPYCQFVIDPTDTTIALKTGLHVERSTVNQQQPPKSEPRLEDSLELTSPLGAEGESSSSDYVDARAVHRDVKFAVGSLGADSKDELSSLHEIPLHNKTTSVNETSPFSRPNEDVLVHSLCVVQKPEMEAAESSKSDGSKKHEGQHVKRSPVQPSLICGVSLRRTKLANENGSDEVKSDVQTEVQLMNKVNEVVSGETSPVIMASTESTCFSKSGSSDDLMKATDLVPYLLVVSGKEDVKRVSKHPSTDSLKPSMSTGNLGNMVQPLGNIAMNQDDWGLLDHMYDSDPDVQMVKVIPGPTSLSTSSPTEGTKQEDVGDNSHGVKMGPSSESAIKLHTSVRAGTVLQCVELPSNLQSDRLCVKSICPTLDRQHLVVVVSPVSSCSSKSLKCSVNSSHSVDVPSDSSSMFSTSSGSSKTSTEETEATITDSSDCNGNTNSSSVKNSDSASSNGCILVYRFSFDCDNHYACIEEKPVAIRPIQNTEGGVEGVVALPNEICEQMEEEDIIHCDEEVFVQTPSLTSMSSGKISGPFGQLAVIYYSGGLSILNCCDLSVLANIDPPTGEKFCDVTYCSGIDRLCLCSSQGKLYFYQLSEEMPDPMEYVGDTEANSSMEMTENPFIGDVHKVEETTEQSPKASSSELFAKQQLTFESLTQLHNLIQFENLMPRFTATVPPCWTEIQQEQQQRRHPQHLQHQGEATQHTRTWKLQPDSNTWDEHLFEIVLPRVCCVGHVDVKFTFNPLCTSTPNIQVTLLKQNINAIGRQSNPGPECASTPVDSKINFNIKASIEGNDVDKSAYSLSSSPPVINNVQDPTFLENHNAEILCGPVNIADCLDLSGNSGLVSLTSPQLLLSKPRSFLLHIKGFPSKKKEQAQDKTKEFRKKRTAAQSADKNRAKTIKALFDNYSPSMASKTKVDNLKGCDWLTELSVTVRKTKKTTLPKERLQRSAMVELTSFHEKLLSTVSFDEGYLLTGVSPDHVQNMCLDILIWITSIQMNDPDKRMASKCILSSIQQQCKRILQACCIQGTRTTAHKCARLLSLCMEYSKSAADPDLAPLFSKHILDALVDCLPLLPSAYSAGGLKWYLTLLNRVKCMDIGSVSSKCTELLNLVAKQFRERASSLHALLKARYGLNGHPFEPDLFDMELPQAVKQIIPGSQATSSFTSCVGGTNSTSSAANTTNQQTQQEDLDFYDLFNTPVEKSSKSLLECARNHILGMLEVEPLHFTCHSTSDGTKMERLDSAGATGSTTVINTTGLGTSGLGSSNISGTINFGESLPQSTYQQSLMPPSIPYSLSQTVAAAKQTLQELSAKNDPYVKQKIMHIKQILYEVGKNTPVSTQKTPSGSSELMPSTPKTTPQVMTPPLTPPNEAWQQMLSQGEKSDTPKTAFGSQQRPPIPVQPTQALLQPPPPQVLVIERIYSGARRFVILDFGKPILLTDVIIPLCGDLASLSIDVWVQGEEVDGQRLVVASDIGVRSLVMNNIMPPSVCRFLKITTIGRYGSGTTRSKIPIGAFYGHSYILPWEWSPKPEYHTSPSTSSVACQLDLPTQSQLLTQLGSFMSLLEDIQCRYSLSRSRLESLLVQVESMQYASYHTQYFLKKNKNNDEDNNIMQTYNDCLQLQLQQNLAMRAIDRLQSAIGLRVPSSSYTASPATLLRQASTDKLRFLLENLLETVISITNPSPSIPQPPTSLYTCMDHRRCQDLFKYLCFHGTPRVQILTGMMLVRVCGSQPWFGDFLGDMLQENFHSETMQVFSQDRVFILLTAMGQRSLQGPCAVSIMESLLSMLARVLSPILGMQRGGVTPHTGQLDLVLIGWVLLFLCRNLDQTIVTNGNGEEEGASKKEQGTNLSNRWNFMQANGSVRSQINKSKSVKLYRRSLQKRLLHHKQKLMDLENVKMSFLNQDPAASSSVSMLKKELKEYASKHLKDIIQIRKNDTEILRKMPQDDKNGEDKDGLDYEPDSLLVLPKEKCLPVVHGLMALLLGMDFTCNVDLFLVTCKVLARVCIATRPAISLAEAMSQEQLEKLIMLAANLEFNHGNISWGGPWAGHALTCLLQDILEGERTYPNTHLDGMTDDEMSNHVDEAEDSLQSVASLNTLDISAEMSDPTALSEAAMAQSKDDSSKVNFDKESSMMVDMLLDEGDYDDDTPEKLHAYVTGENIQPPGATSNVMYVQPMPSSNANGPFDLSYSITPIAEMDDEKYKAGGKENLAMKTLKAVFGSTGYQKPSTSNAEVKSVPAASSLSASSQGLSTAQDARLELGLEMHAELKLKIMLSLQADTLHTAFTSPLPACASDYLGIGHSRSSPTDDELSDSVSGASQTTSFEMLSQAFDDLFSQLLLQRVNMDALMQLWLTLNEENPLDGSDSQSMSDPSRVPIIPLSVTSVTNLLACVAATPSLPVRTWVLVFQSLTLLANLRIAGEEMGLDRSMVVAMMGDSNLVMIITQFLSGTATTAPSTSFESNSQVGPSAVKAFHLFLQRLRICICGEENIHHLKGIMLKLVYTLTAERGAFHSSLGPLDAQCKFLEFILELNYDQVDVNNAISVIESVSALVHRHILCQERIVCRSTSDNGINARSCFGGLFASLLRGGDSSSRNGDVSRDSLMCNLLKMVNALLNVQFPSRHGRRISTNVDGGTEPHPSSEPITDSTKLSQALATSTPLVRGNLSQSDEEKSSEQSNEQDVSQTDEQKTESAHQERTSSSGSDQGINLPDIILGRRNIMCNLIQALSYCNSNTMAMILGSSGMPSNMQDSFTGGDPLSVGDGIYQILVTLSKKCNDNKLMMDSLFLYLSGGFSQHGPPSLCRLSEPLLWFILKVLDSSKMLKLFLEKGGVEVVCRNFVNCNSRIISTSPSLISTIMQNMNGRGSTDKRKKWETESADGLQNFAPLGSIVSSSPTASPAEVLIVSAPQHRRARSAPWSYHFYPDEAWVDLKITLPFAILLKEVQIQPHSQTLSTCPSYVSLEASQDGVTLFPLSAPMCTSSLVYIKLQLQRPEVVTSVTIRLHRARDSMTIGLSQILLMGYSAFGEVGYKMNNLFLPTEDFVSRSSVGWIRLLHHCLVSQKEMEGLVAGAAAPTVGLLNTCSALLVSPISNVYSLTIEAVLLKLGLHSGEMGLALIDNLLRNNGAMSDSDFSSQYLGKVSGIASESTVEILYQLGTVQDRWTSDRVQAMLQWLGDSARVALQRKSVFSNDGYRRTPHELANIIIPGPAPSHVHCIASVLWQSNEIVVEYNLSHLITKHLVSSLYEWSCVLNTSSHLKRAVDYVLCSMCHICPESFTRIMEWMGVIIAPEFGLSASISDDRKDSSHYQNSMTDDSKEASHALGQTLNSSEPSQPVLLHDFKHMCLDESHLSMLAMACKSPLATKQLLESGFPAVLAQGLFEFCNRVISNFADSWSKPEGISDSCKSMNGTSGDNNISQNHTGLCITADIVAAVLNFFSEMSSTPQMKDWLGGADGNIFWPVLLAMLCNTPLHTQVTVSGAVHKMELISAEERATIETATVNFFTSVISCHILNQMLFAKVLYDVIKEQGSASKAGMGLCPLSGFTRRLFLQVLLEDEKVLVAFRAAQQQYRIHIPSTSNQLQHPQFGAGRKFRTMLVNMHMTVGELVNKVLDTPSLAAQLLECQTDKKSDESKKETSQIGLELVENLYAASAVEAASVEPPLSTSGSKSNIPPRPPTRRGRNTVQDTVTKQFSAPQLSLYHKYISNKSLPSDLTLSQLLQTLQQHGLPQGLGVLDFVLQLQSNNKEAASDLSDDPEEVPDDVLLAATSFPTALQIFASVGGLALLAEHLPLLYPEISRQITTSDFNSETGTSQPADASQEWVTVDNYPEDFYEYYEPVSPAPQNSRGHSLGNPTIPPHSLVAFGLFLRLPGYAEVLLKERKKAQCLLRLVLGVTDDGDGGHILTSPLAGSLPTLPFIVLKSLFDATPLTTDDGVLLRRMCLEIGALHLILACLSVLSHHAPRVSMPGFQQEAHTILSAMQAPTSTTTHVPSTSEEKSQQYWAKGTGFGTGSTTSSWDAEQALVRQKSEEEHVTCLLQVLASYINPGGNVPDDFESDLFESQTEKILPDVVPEMLSQSCLVPALSSYLRNDSVLDMARHVPLYRALLQLLRGLSVCPSLVMLLLPLDKDSNGDTATAVGELLDKMRGCVDTYASRLKSNKGKIGGSKEEDEENEGLAMLIPDIQSTAKIVLKATDRMKIHDQDGNQDGGDQCGEASKDRTQEGFDQVYLASMEKLQFGHFEMVIEEGSTLKFAIRHHYENNVKAAGDIKNPNRIRRLAQEAVTLSTSLPLSVSSSVFVRCDEDRLDIMKVLITGPEDTPYANGCFEFDVYFPQDYPNAPPYINLETTGNHTVRFNPNLYNDGKVCLSVLNTWHGRPEEKWSAQTSSFLQVLVSIQSLILVCEPYFNEPGYERSRGTPSGTASSREYDANIRQATVKWAILEQMKNPSPCFKEVIQKHFWLKRHRILKQCEEWIAEMESYSSDKRTGRTIAHCTLALKKHYNQLREEFAKVKAPEGLENFEKGDIDPKEKQYETEQSSPSSSKDTHQIVPADSNANSVVTNQEDWDSLSLFANIS